MRHIESKDATCVSEGYQDYYVCSDCEKWYSNAEESTEITAPVVIPATGVHVDANNDYVSELQ